MNLDELRQRILRGEETTKEELREAINQLRGERAAIAEKVTEKRQLKKGMTNEELDDDLESAFAAAKEELKK